MGHTYTNLLYHVVFSTKERRSFLNAELAERVVSFIGGIIRQRGGKLHEMSCPENHVHLLASIAPKTALSDVIRDVKSLSCAWIRDTLPNYKAFAWQEGFSAFTVGKGDVDRVKGYIVGQYEHHRKTTFEEELVALLERAGIEYDPKYVFD